METIVSAIERGGATERQRVDGSAPASKRREARVERKDANANRTAREEPTAEVVRATAERLNEALQVFNRDLAISVHEDTGQMVVRVSDPTTGDVLRQIPPQQLLDAEVNIDRIIGLFVNNMV